MKNLGFLIFWKEFFDKFFHLQKIHYQTLLLIDWFDQIIKNYLKNSCEIEANFNETCFWNLKSLLKKIEYAKWLKKKKELIG